VNVPPLLQFCLQTAHRGYKGQLLAQVHDHMPPCLPSVISLLLVCGDGTCNVPLTRHTWGNRGLPCSSAQRVLRHSTAAHEARLPALASAGCARVAQRHTQSIA
jgi:hypothetical protein